jgi:hypothetical protein
MNYTRMRMLVMTAKARTSQLKLSLSLASTLCKHNNPLRILSIQPAWLHTTRFTCCTQYPTTTSQTLIVLHCKVLVDLYD